MTGIQELTLSLLSAAGLSVVLSGAVVWLARNWISERLKNSIRHEYDISLASINSQLKIQADAQTVQLKSAIEREAEKIRFATSTIGEGHKATITRKLDGIDALWSGVLAARQNIPPVMGFIDILTVEEYMSLGNDRQFKELVGDLSPEKIAKIYKDNVGSLERVRPYVGEYLWAVFSVNQALTTRVVLLMQMGEKDPKKLNWHKDSGIRQLLNSSFSADEITEFDSIQIGKIGWLQRRFEAKILLAMQNVISGHELGETALRQAQEIDKTIQSLSPIK